jgi:hypothetical protein
MPTPSLPRSLADLLTVFRPCFTAPTFATFGAMVTGFWAQPGLRTVTGMLVGAGLAGRRHHDLAYRFFATARWSADQLGLVLLDLICDLMIPAGAPLVLAVDDTLWRRSGRKLHGAALAPRPSWPRPPPARLGPPLGRGRRRRPPAVGAPGSLPADPCPAVAARRP